MSIIILVVFIIAVIFVTTEHLTGINRAAVAVFGAACGWVAYISYGADFVHEMHMTQFFDYVGTMPKTSAQVKQFIANGIFVPYVGKAAEIVLFLLATVSIVQILQANGCFDFFTRWIQSTSAKSMYWKMAVVTLLLSMNINNLTTAMIMLVVMRVLVSEQRHRFFFGCMIVISANCGGALTVIGDPVGLLYWNSEYVSATKYFSTMLVPVLLVWIIPLYVLSRRLPGIIPKPIGRVFPYRGNDTVLKLWQRALMLIVGLGGLWIIPNFRSYTKLSPFVAALLTLSVLWIVDEIMNRKLIAIGGTTSSQRMPHAMQFSAVQQMFYISGIILLVAVAQETGIFQVVASWIDSGSDHVWPVAAGAMLLSSISDTFLTADFCSALHPVANVVGQDVQNSAYWMATAYATQMGGNILLIGSWSGLTLLRTERLPLAWYIKNVALWVLLATIAGIMIILL